MGRTVPSSFTGDRIVDVLMMAKNIQEHGIPLVIHQVDRGTLVGSVSGVRTAFYEYRYPTLSSPIRLISHGGMLASLEDIACMKLSAVAQRGTKKDFVDVFALLKSGMPLERLLSLYKRKYEVVEIYHLLRSLVYFDAAESERMPGIRSKVKWPDVKSVLRREVQRLATNV